MTEEQSYLTRFLHELIVYADLKALQSYPMWDIRLESHNHIQGVNNLRAKQVLLVQNYISEKLKVGWTHNPSYRAAEAGSLQAVTLCY